MLGGIDRNDFSWLESGKTFLIYLFRIFLFEVLEAGVFITCHDFLEKGFCSRVHHASFFRPLNKLQRFLTSEVLTVVDFGSGNHVTAAFQGVFIRHWNEDDVTSRDIDPIFEVVFVFPGVVDESSGIAVLGLSFIGDWRFGSRVILCTGEEFKEGVLGKIVS